MHARRRARRLAGRTCAYLFFALIVIFLFVPNVLVALFSFDAARLPTFPIRHLTLTWWSQLFSDGTIWSAVRTSLLIGAGATILSVVLGMMAAFALVRLRFRLKGLLGGMLVAPMVTPYVVIGVALLVYWTYIGVPRGYLLVMLGHAALALPFTTFVLMAALRDVDPRLEEAAASLGASRARALRQVTFRLMTPAILAAAALAFTTSFDEFTVAYFLVAPGQNTLPIYIYSSLKFGLSPQINAVATLTLIVSIVLTLSAVAFRSRASRRVHSKSL